MLLNLQVICQSQTEQPFNSLLPIEKFGNNLGFVIESKRRLLSLISEHSFLRNNLLIYFMTLGLKFFLCVNGKFFDFKNTSFRYL